MRKEGRQEVRNNRPLSYKREEKTILVVEDDRTHQALMRSILKECDFNAVVAEDGIAALIKLDTGHNFDLIILDWDMPRLNGLETVREIRAREARGDLPHIPVIAFTSNRQPGDREKCLAAGMDGYLPKDVWLPHWRQQLIDNILQGLLVDNFDVSDIGKPPEVPVETPAEKFSLDSFDPKALGETMQLLKEEFPFVVDEYLEDAAAYIKTIRQGFEEKNAEKVARGSHPLKSNSKGFGLIALSKLAENINNAARKVMRDEDTLEPAELLLPQLQEAFHRAEKRLREVIRNAGL